MKTLISTEQAPAVIGTYSQAIQSGQTVYFSGQIGLDPETGVLVEGGIEAQARRTFDNIQAILQQAHADFDHIVKLTVYLTTMEHYAVVNDVVGDYFVEPYPARAVVAVSGLPREALVEVEGILQLAAY